MGKGIDFLRKNGYAWNRNAKSWRKRITRGGKNYLIFLDLKDPNIAFLKLKKANGHGIISTEWVRERTNDTDFIIFCKEFNEKVIKHFEKEENDKYDQYG